MFVVQPQVVPMETVDVFRDFLRSTLQQVLQGDEPGILATSRIVLVARLALHHFDGFWSILEACSSSRFEEALDVLTGVLSDRLDCVVETELRKVIAIVCLGMVNRVPSRDCLVAVLPRVICICVQVSCVQQESVGSIILTLPGQGTLVTHPF